ncbi:unnamed protein product [Rangifer tarandus platyrhynchus]|uniref:Uncharacterized protein n=1 Tax=Rangifer tarandus platyrhynchus TaxID=3082113 RepID=A0AC59ZL43_RANTA
MVRGACCAASQPLLSAQHALSSVVLLGSKCGQCLRQKLERLTLSLDSTLTVHTVEDHFPGTLCNGPFELAHEVSPAQSPTKPHISNCVCSELPVASDTAAGHSPVPSPPWCFSVPCST